MNLCNVVLSTEPRGGKGGVATVIPMYLEALGKLGRTEFIPTHTNRGVSGKFVPWFFAFFRCAGVIVRGRGSQIVFHLHPGSGFCIIRMLILAFFLRYVAKQYVLIYLHTPYLDAYLNSKFWRPIVGALVRCSDRVIVLTSYARDLLKSHNIIGQVRIVPNPFRADCCRANKATRINENVTILIMGRLVSGKGFVETVRAMAELPENFHLVVAGEGELGDQIRDEISLNNLESRVKMTGWIFGSEKEEYLAKANVFCLPSKVDSFGMSFVEAQCYDLPIVAFRHPPVMEVIRPCAAVFVDIVEPKNLSQAIEAANGLNSIIVAGSGARWVEESFGVGKISESLSEIISDVIA